AVAVAAGLALGLSAPGSGRSIPGAQPYGAKLAAWTARTGAGGAVTITLRQLANAAALQHALAEHGVPAIVHVGDSICFQSDGHPLPGLFRVVTHPPIQVQKRALSCSSMTEATPQTSRSTAHGEAASVLAVLERNRRTF